MMKWYLATTIGPVVVAYRVAAISLKITAKAVILVWKVPFAFVSAVKGSRDFIKRVRDWGKKEPGIHGSAEFADDKKLKARGHLENRSFLMGLTAGGKHVYNHHERAVLFMAPPGVGKSQHLKAHIRSVLKREPDQYPHFIINDAADEHRDIAGEMEAAGYSIFKIDCVRPELGSSYDILAELDPESDDFDTQVAVICDGMIPPEPETRNSHFTNFVRLLLRAAITSNVKYGMNDKSICEIVNQVVSKSGREQILQWIKGSDDEFLKAALESVIELKGKDEGLSYTTTALQKLEEWSRSNIRKVSRNRCGEPYRRGWKMDDFVTYPKPVALFIRTGTQAAAGAYARMIYSNAISAVSRHLDSGKGALMRELELVMDEAGLMGNCRAVIHAFGRLRKAGVRIRLFFLNLDEFKRTYPDWKIIRDGSDMIVPGGSNDMELNSFVSGLIGDTTIENKSHSESDHGESRSRSETVRRLVKDEEVRGQEPGNLLMLLGNLTVKGKSPWRLNPKTGKPESL
jgi:type IV secretory pathway TraG/TraD family ATPase VirD4